MAHGRQTSLAGLAGVALAAIVAALGCDHREPIDPVAEPEARAATDDDRFAAGAASFAQYCALCHGADARGYAADHAPSLVSTTFLETASDEFLARGIRDGRTGTAMAAYGKARGGPVDEAELATIIAFLRAG